MAGSDLARPRRPWIAGGAVAAVLAVVAVLAAVWPGFDARQTPPDDGTVWALQSGDGRRYARVNTVLGELDTVKQVESPSGIAQNAGRLLVFADGGARYADVDTAAPPDLGADADDAFQNTPAGTVSVASAGDDVVYLTEDGRVYAGTLAAGGAATEIDPYPDDVTRSFAATAATVDADGVVYAYSADEGRVVRADASSGRMLGVDDVPPDGPGEDALLSAVGGRWTLLDPGTGDVWVRGRDEPTRSGAAAGAVVQRPSADGAVVYVADSAGLVAVPLDGAAPERVADAAGTPAAPAELDGVVYAAWLPESGSGGTLWSSASPTTTALDYAGAEPGDELSPELVSNGARMILNETRSGWVWTLPDGRLVASSQRWDLDDDAPSVQQEDVEAERVIDPKPPVAVDDAFGVRAGRSTTLPVLLDDHDPNEDVLSVVPSSVEGLDPAFGTVMPAGEQQQLVVRVAADATGSATFRYRVTDGTAGDGLASEPATVTLTVSPDDVNAAPVWCGVEGCLSTWPSPEVAPGGTVTANVLQGWVDPDGDPLYVSSAAGPPQSGSIALDPQGTVTFQHPDPNAAGAPQVPVAVTVSDARGATADRQLDIAVTPSPRLAAASFALVGSVGQPTTVDVLPHVTGASGGVGIRSATPIDQAADVAVNAVAGTFVFTADAEGSYVVQYVVADAVGEATGTVRITLVDPARTQISSPPLTAFVRPGEDTTIDLVSAVSNPAALVLLASDVQVSPDPRATLSVDLVGQSMLRVTGATDDGQPGLLGVATYTVSDGTGNGYTTAAGEVTVVLLPAAEALPPIAVDDAATVRAGAQIDIPLTDNDTAPAGALVAIDPSTITNDSGAGLAFATGRLLRYLAPDEPGTYVVGYTIYRLGFPDMRDTAQATITVRAADTNTAPVPRTLVGRVLSGATVSIPFDRFAVDPDGDAVVLDRVVAQPASGSAAISPDGDAIVYTSAPGERGQVSFAYQVRDAQGATATGDVRVGVLDAASDPSPVTYSDYVQVQVGERGEAVVRPADNDVDPSGGVLDVIDVRPNAEIGSAEYRRMESMLGGVDDGEVGLRAGTELGTYSFAYTVRGRTGDTAIGLIVLKVVRDPVPDYPVVRDTALTVETREDFPRGIDVLGGKASWSAGDATTLSLSLWGDPPAGVTASGASIAGPVPDETLLIPFEVTGTAFDGRKVTSYGFLRVPGTKDLPLTLRSSAASVEVGERSSVDVDMADAVALPPRAELEVDGPRVAAGGARAEARCELVSGTRVRYTAGAGAPWADTCTVPVRLVGQDVYTFLSLRVDVIAEHPQPELHAASLTVSPGAEAQFDLTDMTAWAGTEDWASLSYAIGYSGDQFAVAQRGTTVTVTARDAARPGRTEPVTVRLPSHGDARPATLSLTVGPAPSTLPKGATVAQQCSQASGTSCTITVTGTGGEVNPLPGTPLALVGVAGAAGASCSGVTFGVASASAVQVSWTPDADGTRCTVAFTVQDAQGRRSGGDRDGQVTVDLQGFPKAPDSVTQAGYGDRSITLRVDPGAAGNAYPALQGFRVYSGSQQVTTCTAAGVCAPFAVDANGQQRTYEARAFNAVGDSRTGVSVRAWAYRSPALGDVTATPVYDRARTTDDAGVVRVVIENADPEVRTYAVTGASAPVPRSPGATTEVVVQLPAGPATITVVAGSTNAAPDGSGSSGQSRTVAVQVAALPRAGGIGIADGGERRSSITVTAPQVDGNGSTEPIRIVYVAYRADSGGDFSCTVDPDGTLRSASARPGGQTSETTTISGLTENQAYTVGACVGNGFGAVKTATADGWAWEPPAAPASATYETRRSSSSSSVSWLVQSTPSVPAKAGLEAVVDGFPAAIGAEGTMTAKYCVRGSGQSRCGPSTPVVPADGTHARQAQLSSPAIASCVVGSTLTATVDQTPSGLGVVGIDATSVRYYARSGSGWQEVAPADPAQPLVVPDGAERVDARITFAWTAQDAQYGADAFSVEGVACAGGGAPPAGPATEGAP